MRPFGTPTTEYGMVFLAALALAVGITPLIRALAFRLGTVSTPDARRVHLIPTPLLGGLAVAFAAVACVLLSQGVEMPILAGLVGAGIVLVVGFVDDLLHIPASLKLVGQIVAAGVLIPFHITVDLFGNPWLDIPLTLFWVVGVTNAFNLIDNMDGLSAGVAALGAFFLFAIGAHVGQFIVAGTAVAVCGACVGFLYHNFVRRPARIFMGDTGSLFLGYTLAVLAVRLSYDSSRPITPFVPLLILAVPILDTCFVTLNRIRQGRPITQAGKDHTSHALVSVFGLSGRQAVLLLWLAGTTFGAIATAIVLRAPWITLTAAGLAGLLAGLLASLRRVAPSDAVTESGPSESGTAIGRALVVLPTYNERANIEPLVTELLELDAPVEVLVVDDNSPDGTASVVEAMAQRDARVHLLCRPGKLGLGTAYMAGLAYGLDHGYDSVVTMDADFSHRPEYLPSLLRAAAASDVAIGSRYIPGGGIENWPWHRRILSGGANIMTRLALGMPVRDCTSGYRCYRRAALEGTEWQTIRSNGYSFLEEMLFRVRQAGFSIAESPIVFTDRRAGASKISKSEILRAMATLARLAAERVTGRRTGRPPVRGGAADTTGKQ